MKFDFINSRHVASYTSSAFARRSRVPCMVCVSCVVPACGTRDMYRQSGVSEITQRGAVNARMEERLTKSRLGIEAYMWLGNLLIAYRKGEELEL